MCKPLRIIFYIWFVFVHMYQSIAQSEAIRWYTTEHGLPKNSVLDIVKDSEGFLWMATQNGIGRFDGAKILSFKQTQTNDRNFLYFYTRSNIKDVYYYQPDFKTELNLSKAVYEPLTSMQKHQNFRYEPGSSGYFNNYFNTSLFAFHIDNMHYLIKNNSIFITANNRSEHIEHYKNINPKHLFVVDSDVFLFDEGNQKCWKVSANGLQLVKTDSKIFSTDKNLFWHSLNKQSLFYLKKTFYKIVFEDNEIKAFKICQIPHFSKWNIQSAYYDESYHTLYLGSVTKGLGILALNKFKVSRSTKIPMDYVYYAHIGIDSNRVMTPDGQVLSSKELTTDFKLDLFKNSNGKRDIVKLKNNDYLIKSGSGLYLAQMSKNMLKMCDSMFYKIKFESLYPLGNDIAAGCNNNLKDQKNNLSQEYLYIFKNDNFSTPAEIYPFEHAVQSVLNISSRTALVGTRAGLFYLNRETKKTSIVNGSEKLNIRNTVQTSRGNTWIMTNGSGLFLLKENKLLAMPFDAELALKTPHCILEDNNHNLWISTNNGLLRVPESELLAHAQNSKKRIYYYVYNKKNGFNTDEFNGGCNPCGTKLDNGQFTFPTMEGIVFFNPEQVPAYYPKNGLIVERFKIDGKRASFFDGTLKLQNDFFRATIFPEVPYFADCVNLHVEAFLEGKSVYWERVDIKKGYDLTQLQHGSYQLTFRVLVSPYADFIYKTISVEVEPLFYQTVYFRIFIVILLILSLITLNKIQTNYLINSNKKLELLVHEKTHSLKESLTKIEEVKNHLDRETIQQKKLLATITHDIATPLKYINIVATNLTKLSNEEILKNRDLFHSLQKSSEELYNFTKALKEYATIYDENVEKPFEIIDIYNTVEEKVSLFREIAQSKSIAFRNTIMPGNTIYTNQNILKVALHNIIDNAVKYTSTGTITISLESFQNEINILISNTGIDMDANLMDYYELLQTSENLGKLGVQKFGIGLHMVIQLLPIINGKLHFQNTKPSGTLVTLNILISEL